MYRETDAVQNPNGNIKEENPAFKTFYEKLEKQNIWQHDVLRQIEDKLHQIVNRRSPEKEAQKPNPEISDLSQAFSRQLSLMEDNCHRMEDVRRHLDVII